MLKLPHDCLRMYLKQMVNYKVEATPQAISKVQLWYSDFHAVVSAHISLSKNGLYFPWLKNVQIMKSDTLKQVSLVCFRVVLNDFVTYLTNYLPHLV